MPDMTSLNAFLNEDAIRPTIVSTKFPDGKVYVIPSPDATTGLSLTAMFNLATKAQAGQLESEEQQSEALAELDLDDNDERDLYERVLGPAFDQLKEDNVPWTSIQRLAQYCLVYYGMSAQAASRALETGALLGEAQGPSRAERRHPGKAPKDRQASTASKSRAKKKA
jgi:hypothetical protein